MNGAANMVERILSFDLGSVNTSFSIIEVEFVGSTPVALRMLKNGMIADTIDDLTAESFVQKSVLFKKTIHSLVNSYKVTWVLAERFQQRGLRRGAIDEKVSVMNGIIAGVCLCVAKSPPTFHLVTASQWKNSFCRVFGADSLETLYQENKGYSHYIDALLIGLYAYDLFQLVQQRNLLPRLIAHLRENNLPAPSRKKPTKARARSKRVRATSPKPAKKNRAASTRTSTKRT